MGELTDSMGAWGGALFERSAFSTSIIHCMFPAEKYKVRSAARALGSWRFTDTRMCVFV